SRYVDRNYSGQCGESASSWCPLSLLGRRAVAPPIKQCPNGPRVRPRLGAVFTGFLFQALHTPVDGLHEPLEPEAALSDVETRFLAVAINAREDLFEPVACHPTHSPRQRVTHRRRPLRFRRDAAVFAFRARASGS